MAWGLNLGLVLMLLGAVTLFLTSKRPCTIYKKDKS